MGRSSFLSTDLSSARPDPDPYEEMVWRACQQEAARRLNVPVADMRPCFARIGAAVEGNRNNTAFVYATELRRMGVSEHEGWRDMLRWNRLCKPALSERELRWAFESAYRGQKTYGCRGTLAVSWCVGREQCDWYRQNVLGRRKCRDTDFFDFGWPAVLKSREALVYLALARLEQSKGVGAGGLVIAGTREYVEFSGVGRRHMMAALESLQQWRLLVIVERGRKREAGLPSRACQVKRVVPIPEAPIALANRRREALCR